MASVTFYPSDDTAYDVTDYDTWQSALSSGVSAGAQLVAVQIGNKVVFIEVDAS